VFAGFALIRAICGIPGLTIQRFNDFNAAKPTFRVRDHKNLHSTSVKGQKPHHSHNKDNKQMKGTMQDKTKKKKGKKEIKLPDLKPSKDPKGGEPPPDPDRRPPR
jgi:hypothetical protein